MIYLLATAFIASLTFNSNIIDAQKCDTLCDSKDQVLTLVSCQEQLVSSALMPVCCDDGIGRQDCPSDRKCRNVVIDKIVGCPNPGQGELHCINPAESLIMSLDIQAEAGPGNCCSKCHCAGDPHCHSFSSKFDDWIECDSRDVKKNCQLSAAVCDTQKDSAGNQCLFKNGKCVRDSLTPAPEMTLYQKGKVSIVLTLGERGIIEQVKVKEGVNTISLTAADCRDSPSSPWVGTPIGTLVKKKFGKVWEYAMPELKIGLHVTCVFQGTLVTEPHLDVSVIDQAKGTNPKGVSGFCATGVIDKLKSTRNVTDEIRIKNLCGKGSVNDIALFFNNGIPFTNLKKQVVLFCQKYVGGDTEGQVKKCSKDILFKEGPGWPMVYCAANTLLSKSVKDCPASTACMTCVTDIQDFSWQYAYNRYDMFKKGGEKQGPPCVRLDSLLPDLLECQRGIQIQYFKDGVWNTYRAIPHGFTICPNSGSFNSIDDKELFENQIRFSQCGQQALPEDICGNAPDNCDSEFGFKVSVTVSKKS